MANFRKFLTAGTMVPLLLLGQLPADAQQPDPKKLPPKAAPAAAKPAAPVAVKPAAPAAAKPAAPVAAKPVAPVAVKPVAPAAVKPVAPAPVKPVPPAAMKPVAPAPMKPAAPAQMRPVAPAAGMPGAPAAVAPGTRVPPAAKVAPGVPGKPAPAAMAPGKPVAVPGQPAVGAPKPGLPAAAPLVGAPVPGTPGLAPAAGGAVPGQPAAGAPKPGLPGAAPLVGAPKPGTPGLAPAAVAPKPGVPAAGPAIAPAGAIPGVAPGIAPAGQARPGGVGLPAPVQQPVVGAPVPMKPAPQQPARRDSGISPLGAAAIGAGVGLVGGYLLSNQMNGVGEVRTHRQSYEEGGVTYIREPGRVIVREPGGPMIIRHSETERFSLLGYQTREEREGGVIRTIYDRPDGVRIITVTDDQGRLMRRIRRYPDGREVIIIDNSFRPPPSRLVEQVVVMPPPVLTIPRERYIVDAGVSDERTIYETLTAPPVSKISRRYTLDEVRYSPDLRAQMRSVDVNTITFESGSWTVDPGQVQRLSTIAAAIGKAIQANPEEVFLIEGHTDAVGDTEDNLSLSDRRAQTVAEILTRDFAIPAENLTTQGYGETQLRIQTDDAARANRRVTVRRITPLIAAGNQPQ